MKLTSLISSVMIDMLALSVVDHRLKPQSNQTKDFNIGICCFSAKHAALRSKSKEKLARNKDNDVSEWSNMSTCELLFQWASNIKIQLGMWSDMSTCGLSFPWASTIKIQLHMLV